MKFSELLNNYLNDYSLNQKQLSELSGISAATINRYVSGSREPEYDSEIVHKIASAIESISNLEYQDILDSINETLQEDNIDFNLIRDNINFLIHNLGIYISELARSIHNDPSHISKILSGSRKPSNPKKFTDELSAYISRKYIDSDKLNELALLIGFNVEEVSDYSKLNDELYKWLTTNSSNNKESSLTHFLETMDDFNINNYLQSIHFDEIKLPPNMPIMPTRKEYYGIKNMMQSELDFMKTTVLSKTNDPLIMYSDMPLEEMASDPDFPKNYMIGIALLLKKGLHLNIIHDINRPFNEMMLGLESWIPLYMIGQISPYYFPTTQSNVFNHFLKVSGVAALEGNAIAKNQSSGKYVLYRSKEDVKHYQTRARQMLDKALPLMDIFRIENKERYTSIINNMFNDKDLKIICSELPIYFYHDINKILDKYNYSKETKENIKKYYDNIHDKLISYLKNKKVSITITKLNRSQFEKTPVTLALADLFIEEKINIDYEDYELFFEDLIKLQKEYPNLIIDMETRSTFNNINIIISGNTMAIISKQDQPNIHFVIYHKKMINSLREFTPPIVE